MVHRLDPRFPLVWRTPSSVQVGVDPARVVLDPVSPSAERMLAALVTGATRSGLALVSGGEAPDDLLDVLDDVLEPLSDDAPPPTVSVAATAPTALLIARLLESDGVRLAAPGELDEAPDAAVMVAHYAIPPADRGIWLRRDVPHLPVVYSDTGVVIGPLVEPGRGPCLTCVELHHRDRDPAWPAVASQLLDRRSTTEHGVLISEASAAAVRRLQPRLGMGDQSEEPPPGLVVRLDAATGRRTEHLVDRHPHCGCSD